MFNTRGNILAFIADPTINLNERDLFKIIAKAKEDGSSDSIKLYYTIFEEKLVNFRLYVNSDTNDIAFRIEFKNIRRIEYYRDILVLRYPG